MDYDKIKNDKIQEATDLFKLIGIETKDEEFSDLNFLPTLPEFQKKLDQEKDLEFHWTRLSINSNIGCIAE